MFITLKKYKLILTSIISAVILILVIVGIFSLDNSTNSMIIKYITGIGWKVDSHPVEISYLTIPTTFDIVYQTYNVVQRESGFDLSNYKGAKVTKYTYKVLNHKNSNSNSVVANIFIYQNTVIAADISSLNVNGFMQPITDLTNKTD